MSGGAATKLDRADAERLRARLKGLGFDVVSFARAEPAFGDGLRGWLAKPHLLNQPHLEPAWVICDPSAASFKTQLAEDGITNLANAENDVEYGIKTVASLLGNGDLLVTDRCRGFVNEVTGYSWDEAEALKGRDRPVKVADHYMDAARYSVATTETLWAEHIRH